MNLEDLKERHLEQWSQFFNDRVKSTQELIDQRVVIDPETHSLTDYVDAQEKLEKKWDEWAKEWGVNGMKQKILCLEQSKEFTKYFQKQALIVKMIDAVEQSKELTP